MLVFFKSDNTDQEDSSKQKYFKEVSERAKKLKESGEADPGKDASKKAGEQVREEYEDKEYMCGSKKEHMCKKCKKKECMCGKTHKSTPLVFSLMKARSTPVKYYKKEKKGTSTRYYYSKAQYEKAKGIKKEDTPSSNFLHIDYKKYFNVLSNTVKKYLFGELSKQTGDVSGKSDRHELIILRTIKNRKEIEKTYPIEQAKKEQATEKKERKERSDKGKKRGPYKETKVDEEKEQDNVKADEEENQLEKTGETIPERKTPRDEYKNEKPTEILNVGEDVAGARRHHFDTYDLSNINLKDLEKSGEAEKVINKKQLLKEWGLANKDERVANGESEAKVLMSWYVREMLPAVPANNPKMRGHYLDFVRFLERSDQETKTSKEFMFGMMSYIQTLIDNKAIDKHSTGQFLGTALSLSLDQEWMKKVGSSGYIYGVDKKELNQMRNMNNILSIELSGKRTYDEVYEGIVGAAKAKGMKIKKGDAVSITENVKSTVYLNSRKIKEGKSEAEYKTKLNAFENERKKATDSIDAKLEEIKKKYKGKTRYDPKHAEEIKAYKKEIGLGEWDGIHSGVNDKFLENRKVMFKEYFDMVKEYPKSGQVIKAGRKKLHVAFLFEGGSIRNMAVPVSYLEAADIKKAAQEEKVNRLNLYMESKVKRKGGSVDYENYSVEKSQKTLQDDFGFRGLQYGNSMPDDERQYHTNWSLSSFADLANTLGLEKKQVTANGKLALAFGARGGLHLKGALAHYEPTKKIINLTRSNGFGSMAHEWAHFMDNALGNSLKNDTTSFLSEKSYSDMKDINISGMTKEADLPHGSVYSVVRTTGRGARKVENIKRYYYDSKKSGYYKWIQLDKGSFEPIQGPKESKYVSVGFHTLKGNVQRFPDQCNIKVEGKQSGKAGQLKEISDNITTMMKDDFNEKFDKIENELIKDFLRAKQDYYVSKEETFARAFEIYLSDKMEASGKKNTYLVSKEKTGAEDGAYVYITDKNKRKEIGRLFSNYIKLAKEGNTLEKAFELMFRKNILLKSKELKIGIKAEKEHKELYNKVKKMFESNSKKMPMSLEQFAKHIAKDHLKESDEYYHELEEMEKEFDKSLKDNKMKLVFKGFGKKNYQVGATSQQTGLKKVAPGKWVDPKTGKVAKDPNASPGQSDAQKFDDGEDKDVNRQEKLNKLADKIISAYEKRRDKLKSDIENFTSVEELKEKTRDKYRNAGGNLKKIKSIQEEYKKQKRELQKRIKQKKADDEKTYERVSGEKKASSKHMGTSVQNKDVKSLFRRLGHESDSKTVTTELEKLVSTDRIKKKDVGMYAEKYNAASKEHNKNIKKSSGISLVFNKAKKFLMKAIGGYKYYKREGGPGKYKYYYSEAAYNKAKGKQSVKKEGSGEQPYNMTSKQWRDKVRKATSKLSGASSAVQLTASNHKEYVKEALEQGKKVPKNVLNEYPDLKKETGAKKEKKLSFKNTGDAYTFLGRNADKMTDSQLNKFNEKFKNKFGFSLKDVEFDHYKEQAKNKRKVLDYLNKNKDEASKYIDKNKIDKVINYLKVGGIENASAEIDKAITDISNILSERKQKSKLSFKKPKEKTEMEKGKRKGPSTVPGLVYTVKTIGSNKYITVSKDNYIIIRPNKPIHGVKKAYEVLNNTLANLDWTVDSNTISKDKKYFDLTLKATRELSDKGIYA